jgi:hypothetical protein
MKISLHGLNPTDFLTLASWVQRLPLRFTLIWMGDSFELSESISWLKQLMWRLEGTAAKASDVSSNTRLPNVRNWSSVCVTLNRTDCKAMVQLVRQVAVMMSLLKSTSFIVSILRFILQICGQIVIMFCQRTNLAVGRVGS